MTVPHKFPRFYVTNPGPCPYLQGKTERKVFTELNGPEASEMNDALSWIGFRRSQNVAYRPSCISCKACISVRVVANQYRLSNSNKRLMKRNNDLIVRKCRPWATREQYQLLQRYLQARHPEGGMCDMDQYDFADMVEQSPVNSYMIEYREPDENGEAGKLIGACLTDCQGDGLSMVYSFFDADHVSRKGLGNYIIIDHILRAAEMDLSYVYLGYWVEASPSMQYKTRFQPLELLGPTGWVNYQKWLKNKDSACVHRENTMDKKLSV